MKDLYSLYQKHTTHKDCSMLLDLLYFVTPFHSIQDILNCGEQSKNNVQKKITRAQLKWAPSSWLPRLLDIFHSYFFFACHSSIAPNIPRAWKRQTNTKNK